MKFLLDTQLLLWAAGQPERLSAAARALLTNPANVLLFSAASLWEVAIKEPMVLVTADERLARYPGTIEVVG